MQGAPEETFDQLADRSTLFELVQRERISRDAGRWADLTDCYWPESRVRVTWFDGTAEEFIRRSQEQLASGRGQGIHFCIPVTASVCGDRAVVESRGTIQVRSRLHDVDIDIDHWCRFVAYAERRDGVWRMARFDAIYGKDRMQPVRPDQTIAIDWDLAAPLRSSYRWLAYLNVANGYSYDDQLPGDDRPDLVAEFETETAAWLAGG